MNLMNLRNSKDSKGRGLVRYFYVIFKLCIFIFLSANFSAANLAGRRDSRERSTGLCGVI